MLPGGENYYPLLKIGKSLMIITKWNEILIQATQYG